MNIMDKLGIKRLIAILFVIGFIGFIGYGMVSGKVVPDSYITMVGMVVSFYFAKGSTDNTEIKTSDIKETTDEAQG